MLPETPDTPPDFASVTSDDVRPGETAKQASARRRAERARERRAAAKATAGIESPPAPKKVAKAAAKRVDARPATPPADPPKNPVGRPPNITKRSQTVRMGLGLVAGGVALKNVADAKVIREGAPELADAIAKAADTNRTLAKVIDAMQVTGAWTEIGAAAMAIALGIAANHGIDPFGLGPAIPAGQPAPDIPDGYVRDGVFYPSPIAAQPAPPSPNGAGFAVDPTPPAPTGPPPAMPPQAAPGPVIGDPDFNPHEIVFTARPGRTA